MAFVVKEFCGACGKDTVAGAKLVCSTCVDTAVGDAMPNTECGICGHHDSDICQKCHDKVANRSPAREAREYATRRKSLGLLSIDGYNAIMLMADDLEAIHG